MRVERSNLRAGIGTLAVIGAFCLALWAWLAWRASSRIPYEVWFSKEQGVYGLEPGAPLRVGGIRRGTITRIHPELRDGTVEGYVVQVEVDREVPVTDRTRIRTESAGVSGESYLVAVDAGVRAPMTPRMEGSREVRVLPPHARIAASASDGFRTWGGSASADLMRSLWEAWVPADESAPGLWARLRESGSGMRAEGTKFSGEVSRLTADLDRDLPRWKADFRTVREQADAAFGRIGTGKDAAPDTLVPQLRTIADDIRDMPRIETERLREAGDAFDGAVASVKRLGAHSAELRGLLDDADTALGTTSADYALAAQGVDATVTEVLRAPWTVLATPEEAQLAAAARQDLARLYAEAATDHQRAMKGIEDALRRDRVLLERDPALAAMLRTRLEAANANFESRLAAMEALLLGPAAGASPAHGAP